MSTLGDYPPPFVIFPGLRIHDVGMEAFPDAIYARSESGWMDSSLFIGYWIQFDKWLEEQKIKKVEPFKL